MILRFKELALIGNVKSHSKESVENLKKMEESVMAEIMTTKELARYLKLHEITVCKYASEGRIPSIRIGRVWRFDKEAIDKWIGGQD